MKLTLCANSVTYIQNTVFSSEQYILRKTLPVLVLFKGEQKVCDNLYTVT